MLHVQVEDGIQIVRSGSRAGDLRQREIDFIFASMRRLGVPPDEQEDVAQAVFLALKGSWSRFERDRPLRPYLFAITFRISSGYRRKHARHVPSDLLDVLDRSPGPEQVVESIQAHSLLDAALKRVPLPRRAVLVMHDIDEVPVSEVARAFSIPLFTAYSRLRKARRELEDAVRRIRGKEVRAVPVLVAAR